MTSIDIEKLDKPDLSAILRPVEDASHAPGYIYTSDEVFQLEKDKIFTKEWLCVARAEEIANPGDYFTTRIMGEPILLIRNEEGNVGAFANVCLHRGVEIAKDSGNAKNLACPYHAWTYDLNGNLIGAGFMRDTHDFSQQSCRLKTLHVGEWQGWIFVNLGANPPPLEEQLKDFAADVGFLRMGDCRIGTKMTLEFATNWKFVVENLIDVYHVRTVHIKSFGKHRGSPEKYPLHLRRNGGTVTIYEAAPMTPDGKTLFRRMPSVADREDNFAISAHLSPNVQVIARSDNVHPIVIWPLTPNSTRVYVYNLYPVEFFEVPDFHERAMVYDRYMDLVLSEDGEMMMSLQRGMSSRNYVPGRLSTLEKGVHHVLTNYLNKLFDGKPTDAARAVAA